MWFQRGKSDLGREGFSRGPGGQVSVGQDKGALSFSADAVHVSSGSFPLRSLLPEASSCVSQEEPQQGSEGRRSPRKGHWYRPLSVGLPRAAVFLDGSCGPSPGSANHLQVAPFAPSGVGGVRAPLCSCWGSTKS